MVAYLYRMPVGTAGDATRIESATIEPNIIDSAVPPTAYGVFVKLVAGKIQPVASGDAAAVIYGLNVRPYPTMQYSDRPGLGAAAPKTTGTNDILRRGYIMILLGFGTAAKGGQVYVRVTAGSGRLVGSIETAADSGNCVAVPGAYFMGPADSTGVTEIGYAI